MTARDPGLRQLPMSARRAQVGDRLRISCVTLPPSESDRPPDLLTTVVTVEAVTRLGCGCDRVETSRPRSKDGVCPQLHLLPASCHHRGDGCDFDEARGAARSHLRDVSEPVPPLSERLPRREPRTPKAPAATQTLAVQEALL